MNNEMTTDNMSNEEVIEVLKGLVFGSFDRTTRKERQALDLAIKALEHEAYWEDVKQALNGWLNNTTSPNTALNDIYRAYMGRGEKND